MGKQWKQWLTLIYWASKSLQMVIAAMKLKDTCSWKESYDQHRQHIKKQRHYFVNISPSSQGYGFSSSQVWMWELDVKKAECQRIDAFELWCWKRLLRVPWTARRSNQSTLQEISPGCSLEEMMLKLKLQYFGHLMRRVDSLEKTENSSAGRDEGQEEKGMTEDEMAGWHHRLGGRVWVNSGSWWWIGRPGLLWFMGSQRVGHDWATELNWTDRTRSHDLTFLNVEL